MEYISIGADMYETGWKNNYKSEYLRQACDDMNMTPQALRMKNPEYYKDIVSRASEVAEQKWEEEKLLIAKWEEQRSKVRNFAKMA